MCIPKANRTYDNSAGLPSTLLPSFVLIQNYLAGFHDSIDTTATRLESNSQSQQQSPPRSQCGTHQHASVEESQKAKHVRHAYVSPWSLRVLKGTKRRARAATCSLRASDGALDLPVRSKGQPLYRLISRGSDHGISVSDVAGMLIVTIPVASVASNPMATRTLKNGGA